MGSTALIRMPAANFFLAHIALVFHEHIPQAQRWLEWLRPVLCGIWPIWAGDDGAWAEGPSYGLACVTIMTMFASALKKITGTDLYCRPFWKNHALWRYYCMPSYAEWIGFGDHSQRWAETWRNNADLVELIARQTQTPMLTPYVEALHEQSGFLTTPEERRMPGINAQLYLAPPLKTHFEPNGGPGIFRHFPDTGWAAVRTHLHEPAQDVALIFRSSPYGSISHSHANNNDFILHVGGRCIAMPSGYYGVAGSGYGSDHHAHWLWHTKSHNCLTLSDAPQIMRSHDSTGAIVHPFEDHHLVYFCGHADASYRDRAVRCRRHMVFLKSHCVFIMVDEFVAVPGIVSALQWNLHGWDRFTVESTTQKSTTHRFSVQRGDSQLTGHFLHHDNGFFTQSEDWDPPPAKLPDPVVPPQYNLRFTPVGSGGALQSGRGVMPGTRPDCSSGTH
jgi:hypothetical protein